MTNEEAKFVLEKNMSIFDIRLNCAYDAAIEALEKQIPRKPYKIGVNIYECPVCHKTLHRDYPCKCGQLIDWGEVE